MLTLLYTVFLSLAGLLSLRIIHIAYFSPLSSIPNAHWTASLSRLWLLWIKGTGKEHVTRYALHQKLGPVIRLGPHELGINSIDDGIKTVYSGNYDKSSWFTLFKNFGYPMMFSMIHKEQHTERKRMLAHVYTKTYIQSSSELSEVLRVVTLEKLVPFLREKAKSGVSVDAYALNMGYNLDCVSGYFFGLANVTNSIQDPDAYDKYFRAFEASIGTSAFWLTEFFTLTIGLSLVGIRLVPKDLFLAFPVIEGFAMDLCKGAQKTIEGFESSKDLAESTKIKSELKTYPIVYSQLRKKLEEANTPREELDHRVAGELLDHLHAGHQAAAIVLTYTMWELSKNSLVQSKLREELRSVQTLPPTLPSAQVLDSLPYLDAVLIETMRVYPPGIGPFPRVVPNKGAQIGKYHGIPPGTVVSATAVAVHRNPKVYPEPLVWRPERWTETTGDMRKEMDKWFWAFSSGSRMCIGNSLAMRVMKAYLFGVYGTLETQITKGKETQMEQLFGILGPPVSKQLFLTFREAA